MTRPGSLDQGGGQDTGYWQTGLDPSLPEVARGRRLLAWVNRLSPTLAGRLALHWFGTVRTYSRPAREEEWLEAAERETIPAERGRLAALAWGAGPKVLLAPGWEGRASQMGGIGTALAAAGRRAVGVEPEGHGDSGGRRSSLLRFAEAVEAAVSAEGPFAGFVGHSFGIAGAAFAVQRGWLEWSELAERLVFVCPAADLQRFITAVWEALELSAAARKAFIAGLERHIGHPWASARRGAILTAAGRPLLVLHDREDRDTPIAEAEEVAAAWSGARLVRTEGLGHRRILRAPEVLGEIVAFLSH